MGLTKLTDDTWLDPNPDLAARREGFAAFPQGIQLTPEGEAAGQELAELLGVKGALPQAAANSHEDMCLLIRASDAQPYRLVGAAVAWPSDWSPADKIGKPLRALHEPIAGYEEQLASGVDNFMAKLKPGAIYGRANWFIAPTSDMRWIGAPPQQAFADVTDENAGETLFVRSERQTLRRLPKTGAILFAIGIYVEPLGQLTPGNQARLSDAMETLLKGEGDRRGSPHYAPQLKTYVMRNLP